MKKGRIPMLLVLNKNNKNYIFDTSKLNSGFFLPHGAQNCSTRVSSFYWEVYIQWSII